MHYLLRQDFTTRVWNKVLTNLFPNHHMQTFCHGSWRPTWIINIPFGAPLFRLCHKTAAMFGYAQAKKNNTWLCLGQDCKSLVKFRENIGQLWSRLHTKSTWIRSGNDPRSFAGCEQYNPPLKPCPPPLLALLLWKEHYDT